MKKYVLSLFIAVVVLLLVMLFSKHNTAGWTEESVNEEIGQGEKQEKFESNILDDYEKAYSSGSEMLYYDPESLCAYVDDELTNLYIERQLIYDIDPEKSAEEAKELYQNHYYSVVLEYVAEYDPEQFNIVDGEEGRLRIKIEYMVLERNGQWGIYSSQYRGCTHVSDESAA